MRRLWTTVLLCCLLTPASALASGSSVISDCTDDGRIEGRHPQKDYADALAHLPTDVDEYTDCRAVIRRAQLGGGGVGGGGGGAASGGALGGGDAAGGIPAGPAGGAPLATATPAERAALDAARRAGATHPVRVGGALVAPGALGFGGLGSPTKLPAALIAVLAGLGLAGTAILGAFVRDRVLARRVR